MDIQETVSVILDRDGEGQPIDILPIGAHSNGDGRVSHLYKVSTPNDTPLRESDIQELFPDVACQHAHDCCGHWYPTAGRILYRDFNDGYALVEHEFIQNV